MSLLLLFNQAGIDPPPPPDPPDPPDYEAAFDAAGPAIGAAIRRVLRERRARREEEARLLGRRWLN